MVKYGCNKSIETKMKKLFKYKFFAVIALILLVAAGCSKNGANNSPVALKVWGTFETSDNIYPFITAYQQKYPNVQIQYTEKNVDSYESDLLNALAAGNGPDIFAIHNDWLPKYQDKLAEATSTSFNIRDYKSTFVDVAYNDFVLDNKIFAVPLSVDSLALYYNKDILGSVGIAVPPRTWDELSKDVQKIAVAGSNGFFTRSGLAAGTTANVNRAVDILYLQMLQNGTKPYTQDFSQATLDQAVSDKSGNTVYPAISALSYYTSFANPNSNNYNWNTKSNYSVDAFANGEVGFMYGYSYTRDDILRKSPNLNFDVAPVPQPQLNQNLVNFANYWGLAVSKQSKNPNHAWNFIKTITTKESLKSYYERHHLPSSRRDIISEQTNDPEIGVFASANLTAKSFYKKDQAKVDQIISNMIDSVILRGKKADEAVSGANQQINSLNIQ